MKTKKILFFVVLLFLTGNNLFFAQNIIKINIEGLKRTKDFYIQSKLKQFLGADVEELDLASVEGILRKEELFEEIEVSVSRISESEASLDVCVKEKITFLPLPFAMYADKEFTGGAVVLDMNALGIRDMAFLGGVYSSDYLMGIASYIHSPKIEGFPGFSVFVFASKNENTVSDSKGNEVLAYDGTDLNISLSLIKKFSEHHSVSLGGVYSRQTNSDSKTVTAVEKSVNIWAGKLGVGYNATDWNGTFLSTKSASIDGTYGFLSGGNKFSEISANIRIQRPLTQKLRLLVGASAVKQNDMHISMKASEGKVNSTLFPSKFKTEEIAACVLGTEWAVANTGIGMISLYLNGEAAVAKDVDDSTAICYGPSFGSKLYLSKIAFPALAVGYTYNIADRRGEFSAALGVSF